MRVWKSISGESVRVKVFFLFALLLVSCTRPVVPQVSQKVPGMEPKRKVLAGKVTFVGLTEEELSKIRVIPETGTAVFVPGNHRYDQVDGLWWMGDRSRWLKIPDHGEVWVGGKPERFDGETSLGRATVYFRSQPLWALANAMRGGVKGPGWLPDGGRTKSPAGWPW